MSVTALIINGLAGVTLLAAFFRDPAGARKALLIALRAFLGMLPMVLAIILLIGLLLGLVPPDLIPRLIGSESGIAGILLATAIGGILFVPALVAFPLAGSLLTGGASVGTVAAFITSLTMIGTVTLPIEVRELGLKFTVLRNGLGLVFTLVIAILMGVIL
jgi:uncharacterized membrane protein YraQ (UPF0718 family)